MDELFAQITEKIPFLADDSELPHYAFPPLVEVIFGMQFKELERLSSAYYGRWWEVIRDRYPRTEDKPLISSEIESFGQRNGAEITFTNIPPLPRVWFMSEDGNSLVQLQKDRLHGNWRGRGAAGDYPRFDPIYKKFVSTLDDFSGFLLKEDLGVVESLQYELTYVNRIDLDDESGALNIEKVLPWISCNSLVDCSSSDLTKAFTIHHAFDLPHSLGRLRIIANFDGEQESPALRLQVMVRGIPVRDRSRAAMESWFNMAHRLIVIGFSKWTAEKIQRDRWQRLS